MRDLIVLGILFAGSATALGRPFVGVVLWCWVSYMNPHRLTYGMAYNFPAAQMVGGATLLGLLFTKDRAKLPWERETILLLLIWMLFVITTWTALYPGPAWGRFESISKILLMTGVTMMLLTTKQRLRWFLLAIALSIGLLGVKGGLFSLTGGGADRVYGPPGSTLEDNNDFALANVMIIPMLFYLAREESKYWVRMGLRAAGALSIVSVIFTYSRGGFLGLAAVGAMSLLKARKKFLAITLLVIAGSIGFFFVPQQWMDRMNTIGDKGDLSALGRINAWHFAYNVAVARFPFGGGFDCFDPELFLRYAPDPLDFHAAHSVYFEMLGEQGFLGLFLFVTILASTFLSLQTLRFRYGRWPALRWVVDYADMIQIGLTGYVVSGAFLGRANFDLYYHLVAATIVLKTLARQEAWRLSQPVEEESEPEPEPEARPDWEAPPNPAPA